MNKQQLKEIIMRVLDEGLLSMERQLNEEIESLEIDKKHLKDFVRELKEHSVKVDNERAVKVSTIDRLLAKYTK